MKTAGVIAPIRHRASVVPAMPVLESFACRPAIEGVGFEAAHAVLELGEIARCRQIVVALTIAGMEHGVVKNMVETRKHDDLRRGLRRTRCSLLALRVASTEVKVGAENERQMRALGRELWKRADHGPTCQVKTLDTRQHRTEYCP